MILNASQSNATENTVKSIKGVGLKDLSSIEFEGETIQLSLDFLKDKGGVLNTKIEYLAGDLYDMLDIDRLNGYTANSDGDIEKGLNKLHAKMFLKEMQLDSKGKLDHLTIVQKGPLVDDLYFSYGNADNILMSALLKDKNAVREIVKPYLADYLSSDNFNYYENNEKMLGEVVALGIDNLEKTGFSIQNLVASEIIARYLKNVNPKSKMDIADAVIEYSEVLADFNGIDTSTEGGKLKAIDYAEKSIAWAVENSPDLSEIEQGILKVYGKQTPQSLEYAKKCNGLLIRYTF